MSRLVAAASRCPRPVETYILEIVAATRTDPSLMLGASPRASIALAKASQVHGGGRRPLDGVPRGRQGAAAPVLAHRMMLTPDAMLRGETVDDVLERVTSRVKAPLGVTDAPPPPMPEPSRQRRGQDAPAARRAAHG